LRAGLNKGPPIFTYVIYRDALTARNKEYLSVPAAPRLPDTCGLYVKQNIDQLMYMIIKNI